MFIVVSTTLVVTTSKQQREHKRERPLFTLSLEKDTNVNRLGFKRVLDIRFFFLFILWD